MIAERQLDITREHADQLRAEAEREAEQVLAEAVARADRIRSESERELAAAIQRRDIQLADVRQMLTTLTRAGSGALEAEPAGPAKPAASGA